MPKKLTKKQIAEIREYWGSDDRETLRDPIFQLIPAQEREQLARQADEAVAQARNISNEDFQRQLGHEGKTPKSHSIWGGRAAKETLKNYKMAVESKIANFQNQITELVCIKFDYCAKRKRGDFESEEVQLAIAIAELLLTLAAITPVPITMLSVYLVKNGVLDRWCKCNLKDSK
jgi:hypothetical protein